MKTRASLAVAAALAIGAGSLHADVFSNVPETSGYRLDYTLPIPAIQGAFNSNAIPYTTNNSGTITTNSFSRVGYYLELAGSADPTRPNGFVYASFDVANFTNNATNLGVPANNSTNGTNNGFGGFFSQASVTNLHVVSNVPGIANGTFATGGQVEFWPSNYNGGANGEFDHDDGGFNGGSGHGSMQIHNLNAPIPGGYQTLFGYSDWGGNSPGSASEIGIGTNTGTGHPDWTFSDSGTAYTVRSMQIVVDNTPLPPPPPSIKIMPLGDSITDGVPIPGGYRTKLYNVLAAAFPQRHIDFVGSTTDNPNGALSDSDHEGHSGFRLDNIDANLSSYFAVAGSPDYILLHLGTNDFGQGADLATAQARMFQLVTDIFAQKPGTTLIVSSLLNRTDGAELNIPAFNASLPDLVAHFAALGDHIFFLDMNAALNTTTDLADGLHPNQVGYDKMADAWFGALDPLISASLAVPEPSSLALTGLAGLALLRRRR
jgi:lysophospholipase L1-like esterase